MLPINDFIIDWLSDRKNNAIEPGSKLPAFDAPLVGIAAGDDPLFDFIKDDIGADFYWSPLEAFQRAFPDSTIDADELSIISWILPQTETTRIAHRKEKTMPSIEWSKARHFGEMINENLRKAVVNYCLKNAVNCCAPTLLHEWQRHTSAAYGFASCWSERHTAHVAGLGTFGLSDGLITPAGKAVRIGSVVAQIKLPPTLREYVTHNQWCLFYTSGTCLACARRCPAGAISKEGHDKVKCKEYIRKTTRPYVEKEQLGYPVNSCGLCQTRVPCESRNPYAK